MRKKKRFFIVVLVLFVICSTLFIGKEYLVKKANRCKQANLVNEIQGIYGAMLWAKICDANDIKYNTELLDEIKEKYAVIIKNSEDNVEDVILVYLLSLDKWAGIDSNSHQKKFHSIIDEKTGLISFSNSESDVQKKLIKDYVATLFCVKELNRAGLVNTSELEERISYYFDSMLNGDYDISDNINSSVFYFWRKNKCENVDMSNSKIVKSFKETYDNVLANRLINSNPKLSDLSDYTFIEICQNLGIDTLDLEKMIEGKNIFYESEENWNVWSSKEIISSVHAYGAFFDTLIDTDKKYILTDEFCEAYSNGLNEYCNEVLIPALNKIIETNKMR